MQVFYCDQFELPLPEGHRFPIEKYRRTREAVSDVLGNRIRLRVAPRATREQLSLVHSQGYLKKVFEGLLSELEQRRIGFPWSQKMLERSLRSTGATIAAAEASLDEGIALHLSGGTHHAFRDQGQGFCVFNDVAVAATVLFQQARIQRALVVDLDVHQGNGTAAIFADDPRVFTFSMHGDRNYPFRKMAGDLDIALSDGTGDETYLDRLNTALQKLLPRDFDVVFYLAGADAFAGDRMGRLKLTKQGLERRDQLVITHFGRRGIPIVVVLAGGYAAIEDIVDIHLATALVTQQQWEEIQRTRGAEHLRPESSIGNVQG